MAALKVIAKLSATGETARAQLLLADSGDCRDAGKGKITSGAKDGACECIPTTLDSSDVAADIEALPISGLRRNSCSERQNHRAEAGCNSVYKNPLLLNCFEI